MWSTPHPHIPDLWSMAGSLRIPDHQPMTIRSPHKAAAGIGRQARQLHGG